MCGQFFHGKVFACIKGSKINCAKKTETSFLFTGPRHGFYTGFAKLQNALEIYTTGFDQINVDAKAHTMTIGGAVVFKNAANALYAAKQNIRKSRNSHPRYAMDARYIVCSWLT